MLNLVGKMHSRSSLSLPQASSRATQSTCSDGSLLSMGSSENDEVSAFIVDSWPLVVVKVVGGGIVDVDEGSGEGCR